MNFFAIGLQVDAYLQLKLIKCEHSLKMQKATRGTLVDVSTVMLPLTQMLTATSRIHPGTKKKQKSPNIVLWWFGQKQPVSCAKSLQVICGFFETQQNNVMLLGVFFPQKDTL